MALRDYEDWVLLIGTILAAFSQFSIDNPKLALAFLIIAAVGKALLSLLPQERQKPAL